MKPSRFFAVPFGVALFLAACGGGDGDTTTDTTTSTDTMAADTAGTATTTATGGYDTTATYMMLARHRVKNFTQWKASYDAHDSMRVANNLQNYAIGRSVRDSNDVLVAVTVNDTAKAKTFAKDPSLKKAMREGGVTGTPTIRLVAFRGRNTAAPDTALRVMTTFAVKDWEAWRRSYDSTRQLGTDNGLVMRGYGHELDNNRRVFIISAITDSTKASAFWNSDLLKQRRAAGGVVGQPERYVYRVVQRY